MSSQSLRFDLDLQLPVLLSPDRDVRDTRYAHEPGRDRPSRQDRHLERGEALRGDPDDHDPPRRRQRLQHLWRLRYLRQRVRLGESLRHDLPSTEEVRARLEDEKDSRQPGHRLGADVVEERHTVQQVLLQRDGDQLLHFGRGETEGLRLNLNCGRSELGQDVGGHLAEPSATDGKQRCGE